MKQLETYPIDREIFTNIFTSIFSNDNISKILDIIYSGYESEKYKCWIYDDEVYLLNKETGMFINWYKLDHIGRCLQSTIGSDSKYYFTFFIDLYDDMIKNEAISK